MSPDRSTAPSIAAAAEGNAAAMPWTEPTGPEHLIEFSAMASRCSIRLAGVETALAGAWADQAIAEVRRIEAKYSRYRADSVVSHLNAAAGQPGGIEVDDETAGLIGFAAALHRASDGLFDITSGVLRRAWDFRSARLPDRADVQALLPLVGWQRVEWDGVSLRLPRAGMELDFGGFGKEYAADRAASLLQSLGATSGIVNLGGDLRVLGPQPDGQPWRIGIAHPRRLGEVIASLPLTEGALATSGDYERYLVVDGRRYCHLLDPRSGWPVSHWQSVSVSAPACLAAGAISSIAMLMEAKAADFLRQQGATWMAVDADGRLQCSDALEAAPAATE